MSANKFAKLVVSVLSFQQITRFEWCTPALVL